ncbi:unnamed protein product, partial [Vitrella brassicaformis CCMP3155]
AASYLHIPRLIQIAQIKIALYLRAESSPSEIAILVNKAKAVSVGASPEDGGQVKRSAEGEAKGASGSGRQPGLRQPLLAFASIPYDVLALTLALLPLDLLSAAAGASLTPVDTREWEVLAANYTHLIIDHDDASATFFEKLSFAAAYEWGRRLPHLRSITVRHPRLLAAWCLRVVIGIVEGHAEARAALVAGRREEGRIPEGSLESITFEPDEDHEEDIEQADKDSESFREDHELPPDELESESTQKARAGINKALSLLPRPSTPSPYLPAVRSIVGLAKDHNAMADREWQTPALEMVTETVVTEHDCVHGVAYGLDMTTLGKIIQTSERLQELVVTMEPDPLADALSMVPLVAVGEGGRLVGRLAGLRSIGTLLIDGTESQDAGLTRLKSVLLERGCRSFECLSVEFCPVKAIAWPWMGGPLFATISALESFQKALGGPPVAFRTPPPPTAFVLQGHSDTFFLRDLLDVPDSPSPLFVETLQHLARRTRKVEICFSPQQLLDYHHRHGAIRPAVHRVANSLIFCTDRKTFVEIYQWSGWDGADATAAIRGLVAYLLQLLWARSR